MATVEKDFRFSVRNGPENVLGDTDLNEYELGIGVTKDTNGNVIKARLFTTINTQLKEIDAGDANTLDGINQTSFARLDGIPGDNGTIPQGTNPDGTIREAGSAIFAGDVRIIGTLDATAERAKYADIAEYYETKDTQEAGQILMFGTDFEGEIADGSKPLLGVCSTAPAYLMNTKIETEIDEDGEKLFEHFAPVALKGRVPVLITGSAKRGQYIILDLENPGFGKAVNKIAKTLDRDCNFIGICITEGTDTCEVKV